MIRRYESAFRALLMASDGMLAVLAVLIVSVIRFGPGWQSGWGHDLPFPVLPIAAYVAAWITLLWLFGLYNLRAHWSLVSEARGVGKAMAWLMALALAAIFASQLEVSRLALLIVAPLQVAFTLAARALLRLGFGVLRQRGRNARYVLLVGTGAAAVAFATRLEEHRDLGLHVIGMVGDPGCEGVQPWPNLGEIEQLPDVLHGQIVDEVAICLPLEDWHLVGPIVGLCESEGKIVRLPLQWPNVRISAAQLEMLDDMPVFSLLSVPSNVLALATKRAIDLVVSAAAFVLLLPLLGAVSLAIALTDGRPITYSQERVGLQGRHFRLLKFRTMVRNADALRLSLTPRNEIRGPAFKLTDDPRITPIGRWLRRTSLDELPQLVNVLRGDMSIVGPRPPLADEVAVYDAWHRRRLSMKPGMTGLWQIEGRRAPEFDQWVRMDLDYIDRWSPWLDIKIMLRTIPALIRSDGR